MKNQTDGVDGRSVEAAPGRRGADRFHLTRRGWLAPLGVAGLVWCVALLVWAQHGLDETLVRQAAARDPKGLVVGLALVASKYGMAAIAAVHLVGLVTSLFREAGRRHRNVYLLTLMSFAISGVAGDVLKDLVDRPRPALQYSDLGFAAGQSSTHAFPSGHSTKSVALALPFLLLVRGWRGWRGFARLAVAGLAVSVCASRVLLGAHFLSDVVGGLAMALSGLPLAVMASNVILGRMTPSDMDRAVRIWAGVYAVLIPVLVKLS
jgi:membrane-associated phospholipid phosphatase